MTEPCRNECGDNGLIEDEDEWRKTIPDINYKDITFSDGLILVSYMVWLRPYQCFYFKERLEMLSMIFYPQFL